MTNSIESSEESTPVNAMNSDILKQAYPANVINGVMESLREADNGELMPYTGIIDMLDFARRI